MDSGKDRQFAAMDARRAASIDIWTFENAIYGWYLKFIAEEEVLL